MRFASLGSGSRGNATLVESSGRRLLVDCGFSARETQRRLARLGCEPQTLDGVVVTHEHGDHVSGLLTFARRHRLPIWMTPGTHAALGNPADLEWRPFRPGERFSVGGLEVRSYAVPHDAREPGQLVFSDGARHLGLLTDAGHVTDGMIAALAGCHGLILECNHDPRLLAGCEYPPSVKQRIAGPQGHLSNHQAAEALQQLASHRIGLQHVVAAHISASSNTPALAQVALAAALGCHPDAVAAADQGEGLDWRDLR